MARKAKSEYLSALKLLGRSNIRELPCVYMVSSKNNEGFPDILEFLVKFLSSKKSSGELAQLRHLQKMKSFEQSSKACLLKKYFYFLCFFLMYSFFAIRLMDLPGFRKEYEILKTAVENNQASPSSAAWQLSQFTLGNLSINQSIEFDKVNKK